MRRPLATLFLVLAGALAGCLDPGDAASPADASAPSGPSQPPLPAGFTQKGAVTPSLYNPGGYCQAPHSCAEYGFAVEEGWAQATQQVSVRAALAWGLPGNELDLVLFRGTTELVADYGLGSTTAEITATLEPGDYTLLVDSYAALGADEYELVVSFEAVGADA